MKIAEARITGMVWKEETPKRGVGEAAILSLPKEENIVKQLSCLQNILKVLKYINIKMVDETRDWPKSQRIRQIHSEDLS